MTQRILMLTGYLCRRLLWSLTGLMYVLVALVYWAVFFPPQQGTPDVENYMLVIGAFGAGIAFLAALSLAARANEAAHASLLVRLPSRVEYLTAVLLSALITSGLLQLLVAVLAMFRGPVDQWGRFLEIPPLWIAVNVLSIVLALHASDFVAAGWSRVYIFGLLAIFLFGQSGGERMAPWLARQLNDLGRTFVGRGWLSLATYFNQMAAWLRDDGGAVLGDVLGFIFWPFRAMTDAIIQGYFSAEQALAPAVLLLYATILFMLAADLFAAKDIELME
jgi:hypothetical protein